MKAFIAVAFAVTVISAPALSKDIQMNHCFSDDQSTAAIDVVQQHEPRDRLPRDLDQLRYLRDTACLDIEMMMDYVRQKTAETNGEIDTVERRDEEHAHREGHRGPHPEE